MGHEDANVSLTSLLVVLAHTIQSYNGCSVSWFCHERVTRAVSITPCLAD